MKKRRYTGIRLPRGGWLKNPFEDIKFTGKSDAINPIRFLKKFESTAKYEGIKRSEQLHFFGKCMQEQASTWWELQDFMSISEAKEEFIKFYWGDDQQARFREKLYTGRYKAAKNMRMSDYALNMAKQARTLNPPMSDKELIRCIKRHFDRDIAREIRSTTATTLMDLVYLLEEIQDEKETTSKMQTGEKRASQTNSTTKRADSGKSREQKPRYQDRYAKFNKPKVEPKALPWHTNLEESRRGKTTQNPKVEFPASDSDNDSKKPDIKSKTERKYQGAKAETTAEEKRVSQNKMVSTIKKGKEPKVLLNSKNENKNKEDTQPQYSDDEEIQEDSPQTHARDKPPQYSDDEEVQEAGPKTNDQKDIKYPKKVESKEMVGKNSKNITILRTRELVNELDETDDSASKPIANAIH
ncbi:uncharacterized protein DDB_G0284459-like [Linepithema humile]|uniref:uncharacterized protein DDB_G0284459-like n=1 Tax=Linepithema humile TaxID=83485 RepID=UPI00351E5F2B